MKVTFGDILYSLLINWKPILVTSTAASVVFFLILFFAYPLQYHSRASLLPPDTGGGERLTTLFQNSILPQLLSEGSAVNPQLSLAILHSRSAAEYVVRRTDVKAYYGVKTENEAVRKLQKDLDIELTKEGILFISVPVHTSWFCRFSERKQYYKSLAASITVSYLEALDRINNEKLAARARRARQYIEDQKTQVRAQLDSVESNFAEFQKSAKAISLPEQIKSSIESASRLKSEIMQTEITIALASQNMRENNPVVLGLQSKLNELRQKYAEFESRTQDILLSFKDAPGVGMEYASLLRDVKSLNDVYLMLEQLYYKEKIQENKDLPTIETLDPPVVPEKESAPRTLFSTFLCFVFSFLTLWSVFLFKHSRLKVFNGGEE